MANTQKDINDYLDKYATPTTTPPVGGGSPVTERNTTPRRNTPNVVSPFVNEAGTQITQGIGERPWRNGYGPMGHEGVDMINQDTRVTNPIGGINVTGTQYPGYGNWQIGVGANPQELADMDPKTEQEIRSYITQYMLSNPSDIRGLNIPGKNISMQAHLASPAPSDAHLATGSASMEMGGSGGWSPHLHSAFKNTSGTMQPITDMIQKELQKRLSLTL